MIDMATYFWKLLREFLAADLIQIPVSVNLFAFLTLLWDKYQNKLVNVQLNSKV